ncbi:AlpA family transcriptional regulator [Pseudonocardia sp. WMMC193]|uniref:helix-turn-helix transcriptional regulator n=1 Tax=Pseudonocardia sp. WMMC193 TaxID=2911965 RepID=UPI001F2DB5E6|nr:helix-turn-helix domain-containing protein [Pseudonocardia sp. WMMC193]MCF7550488.1 helix-turn-helix domain-containing protein [Pseudonocardia sp. WMMC193]
MQQTDTPAARLADDPDRLWNYREFAAWAGVAERTARDWIARGNGPRVLAIGKHRRIRVGDALTWLDTRYVNRDVA